MYTPKIYTNIPEEFIRRLVEEDPFATIISPAPGNFEISHLPLLWEKTESGAQKLVGHIARANPQSRAFAKDAEVYVIFHGPHSFISPVWYEKNDVPTWNYAVVHVRGRVRLVEDYAGLKEILRRSTQAFDAGEQGRYWEFEMVDDLRDPDVVVKSIAGFEIDIQDVQAKFKFSQNRSAADQQNVARGLAERSDPASRRLADWMRAYQESRG